MRQYGSVNVPHEISYHYAIKIFKSNGCFNITLLNLAIKVVLWMHILLQAIIVKAISKSYHTLVLV